MKDGDIMKKEYTLLECQKKFLFNSRYEPTEWIVNKNTPMYVCDKGRVNIYCDIPDDLNSNLGIDAVIDIHKKMFGEMVKVCQKCKYYNL